jgi:hypothetical protein
MHQVRQVQGSFVQHFGFGDISYFERQDVPTFHVIVYLVCFLLNVALPTICCMSIL